MTALIFGFVCYFTPWIVARLRQHRQKYAILALNIFTGWTGVGWIAALVWSLTQ